VTLEAPHQEVLGEEVKPIIESFPIGHRFTTDALKDDSLRIRTHLLAEVLSYAANSGHCCDLLLVVSDS